MRLAHICWLALVGLLARPALAQECPRPPCASGEVDANGCCPARPAVHVAPANRAPPASGQCSGPKCPPATKLEATF